MLLDNRSASDLNRHSRIGFVAIHKEGYAICFTNLFSHLIVLAFRNENRVIECWSQLCLAGRLPFLF
jgi:hypothetical protein